MTTSKPTIMYEAASDAEEKRRVEEKDLRDALESEGGQLEPAATRMRMRLAVLQAARPFSDLVLDWLARNAHTTYVSVPHAPTAVPRKRQRSPAPPADEAPAEKRPSSYPRDPSEFDTYETYSLYCAYEDLRRVLNSWPPVKS